MTTATTMKILPLTSSPSLTYQVSSPSKCSEYILESTVKPAVKLKEEPKCTESEANLDQLIQFIGLHFDKHKCGNTASTVKYTQLLYCSMLNTHKQCLPPLDEADQKRHKMEAIPSFSAVEIALKALCAVNHSLDRSCLFKRLKYVAKCVKTDVELIFNLQNEKWTYGTLNICRHLEIKIMCAWEELQPCGYETAGYITRLIGVQLRPDACQLSKANASSPFIFLIIVMLVMSLST